MILLLSNCKKENTTYKLKGQIVLCNNGLETSFANEEIDLFQTKGGSNNNSKVLGKTKTDAQGNFSFEYATNNIDDRLVVRVSTGSGFLNLISGIPADNISDLKVCYSARYNLVVGLNVTKPYTNNDTLYVENVLTQNNIKIAGPFTSKRLYVVGSKSVSSQMNYGGNIEKIRCSLNGTNDSFTKQFLVENSKLCGDTVYVNLDIK